MTVKVWMSAVVLAASAGSAIAEPAPDAWWWPFGAGSADGDVAEAPPRTVGPATLDLGHAVELALPEGFGFQDQATTRAKLLAAGESADDVLGLVDTPTSTWSVLLSYDEVGYVDDSEADELDADSLFESIREGTLAGNAERAKHGTPALFVDAWTAAPRYDRASHMLRWGLGGHEAEGDRINNEMSRVLGRRGYVAATLIDTPENMARAREEARAVLAGVHFQPGARYADHEGSDRDSGMGLRTLVLGGAGVSVAAKTGLLAAIVLALKKGAIAIAAVFGGLAKWITGKKKRG